MSGFRPDVHVAQQSRRDKLRLQYDLFHPPLDAGLGLDSIMFSSAASAAAQEFAASGGQVPLGAPSSTVILGDVALQPQSACDWTLTPPQPPPYTHLYCHQPKISGFTTGIHDPAVADLQSGIAQAPPCSWSTVDGCGGAGEVHFLPSYATDAHGGAASSLMDARHMPVEWTGVDEAAVVVGGASRGLSLTLASVAAGPSSAHPKISICDRAFTGSGGSLQDVVGRGAGPLGPFTGYATILKNSRFLRPAQLLLDECCSSVTGSKLSKRCYGTADPPSEKDSESIGCASAASTSALHGSAPEAARVEQASAGTTSITSSKIHRPEFQQKKAKLLQMQEEVCKKYKQYHQQMQMVVSSFESVAGLSSAIPYASLALKTISKHFRSLKTAISDQIRHISKALGEEFISSPSSTATPRLKYLDQNLRKQKMGENSTLGFMENNQPVWRPQRGLPERAVSVLRAWLFEHFLHPYPTDTDKHMLATQTGLSRNQVSNWFINARVRLWKPMIEEIHMLESKGMGGMDLNSANSRDTRPTTDNGICSASNPRPQQQCIGPMSCTSMYPVFNNESCQNLEPWQGDKRSRVEECEMLSSMDDSLMSFATYQHAMDIGGIEAVSLTLGLKHDGGPQNPQQMRPFGTQMLHDFVG
ncbi:BEL1-like homeodomain protein 8 [Zingiber officinale]|nr:BEL1-like homeodomain protein 8 [Zingiber officinale]